MGQGVEGSPPAPAYLLSGVCSWRAWPVGIDWHLRRARALFSWAFSRSLSFFSFFF